MPKKITFCILQKNFDMKKLSTIILFTTAVILISCNRPEACIEDNYPETVNVGDTVRFERCDENNLLNDWGVNGGFLNKSSGFGEDHLLIDGGGLCDEYAEIQFLKSGTFSVDFETGVKKSGNCGSVEYHRSTETSVNVVVN